MKDLVALDLPIDVMIYMEGMAYKDSCRDFQFIVEIGNTFVVVYRNLQDQETYPFSFLICSGHFVLDFFEAPKCIEVHLSLKM